MHFIENKEIVQTSSHIDESLAKGNLA